MAESSAREIALKYVELYNDGTPDFYGSDRFLDLYAEDVEWREMPSQFFPEGRTGDLSVLRQAVIDAQAGFADRRIDLVSIVSDGDRAAMQLDWGVTVATEGFPLPKGARLRLAIAQFITVRGGKISASTEYPTLLP